jgi:hypothetical protein
VKVFYDCEFIERGNQLPIQLVSIALVPEDGRQPLYRINAESLSNVTRHPWLAAFVVPQLPIASGNFIFDWDKEHPDYPYVAVLDQVAADVLKYMSEIEDIELWGYYSAYDHVVLCQLFGSMSELPPGIPMWTHDIMALIETRSHYILPPDPEPNHHALYDALWTKEAYERLMLSEHDADERGFLRQPIIATVDTQTTEDTPVLG